VNLSITCSYLYNCTKPLIDAIKLNLNLRSLDLSDCHLDDGDIEQIGKYLKADPSLTYLNISENRGIQRWAVVAFSEGIKNNSNIKKLRLFNISDSEWQNCFVNAVNKNQSLIAIDSYNADFRKRVAPYLKRNRAQVKEKMDGYLILKTYNVPSDLLKLIWEERMAIQARTANNQCSEN
jgi:hypothetical protein